jgi:hypothetical protein
MMINDEYKEKRAELVSQLSQLEDEELIDVLRLVFETKAPYPNEEAYLRNHFFLGVATSELIEERFLEENTSSGSGSHRWSHWNLSAVAYLDMAQFPKGVWGPGFCQGGRCPYCNTAVVCNAKSGLCPICGTQCSLT